jgi:hypothetical protein
MPPSAQLKYIVDSSLSSNSITKLISDLQLQQRDQKVGGEFVDHEIDMKSPDGTALKEKAAAIHEQASTIASSEADEDDFLSEIPGVPNCPLCFQIPNRAKVCAQTTV